MAIQSHSSDYNSLSVQWESVSLQAPLAPFAFDSTAYQFFLKAAPSNMSFNFEHQVHVRIIHLQDSEDCQSDAAGRHDRNQNHKPLWAKLICGDF